MLKLRNIKVSYKLTIIIAVGILGFLSLLAISANALKQNLIFEREARLNAVIRSVFSQVAYLNQTLPRQEAQQQAQALIKHTRFDGENYLFVIDENRYTIVHPIRDDLVGKQMGNGSDGQFWFTMVEKGSSGRTGSLIYPWQNNAGQPADKLGGTRFCAMGMDYWFGYAAR